MEDFFLDLGNGHLLFFVYDAVRLLGYSCCPALLYTMLFHSDSPSSGTVVASDAGPSSDPLSAAVVGSGAWIRDKSTAYGAASSTGASPW